MSSLNQHDKPFWLRPPWSVLFDLVRLQQVRPWAVDLSYLLNTLIQELRRKGYMDFTASGIALLSSATIYRMKSELLLDLQEPPPPPSEKPVEFIPPPLQPPFRFEYTTTNIDVLVKALEDVLVEDSKIDLQPRLISIPPAPPITQEIDEFMVNIENKIENMYQIISRYGKDVIPLSNLMTGLTRRESIRIFLLVLFLACRAKIRLWQEEDFGEIYLNIKRNNV